MNPSFSAKSACRALWAGAILCAFAASAQTTVTFQVDMSNNPLAAGQSMVVSGTFDGWATGSALTNNPNAANPNLYTGTYVDTSDANGKAIDWQYRIVSGSSIVSYSAQDDGNNYCVTLPASGGTLVLPVQFWDDDGTPVTNSITFQVDMAEQLNLGNFSTSDNVYCQGYFEGWSDNFQLTNNPALNVTNGQGQITSFPYQGTYTAWSASPGAAAEYKFVYNNGGNVYEAPTTGDPDNNENRAFLNVAQVLPLVSFSDVPFVASTATNAVTFEIDMTTQIAVGGFTNGSSTVEIHGDYNAWGSGTTMTNNPGSATPNIYSTQITYVDAPGAYHYFKYVIQPGTQWESLTGPDTIGGNRFLTIQKTGDLVGGVVYLTHGPVYFSDEPPSSLIDFVTVTNCMVTFTVQMTNAVGTDGTVFDNAYPSSDTIYINGLNGGINNSFATWAQPPFPGNGGTAMTQIPNTMLFTATVPVNLGQNDLLTYKYSINGFDNEAASGDNHQRWIRGLPDYTMPVDKFGSQGISTQTEIPAGNLTIANTNGTQVSLSWLGRRGVQVQAASSLTGPWTSQPLTDGTNLIVAPGGIATTNFNVGSGDVFYRLVGPQ